MVEHWVITTRTVHNVLCASISESINDSDIDGLPSPLRRRMANIINPLDRAFRWTGYALLKRMLQIYGLNSQILETISYTSTGRPYLPQSPLDFNLSHSGHYVVCGATTSGKIGVDIERSAPIDLHECREAFSETAWKNIIESPDPHAHFYHAWTRLEAVAKAEGFGISGPLKAIRFEANGAWFENNFWHLIEIPIEGYSCHVASTTPISMDHVTLNASKHLVT